MKKNYSVYMVLENGAEQFLVKCRTQKQAETKCRRYELEDKHERSNGYHVPNTKYIIK